MFEVTKSTLYHLFIAQNQNCLLERSMILLYCGENLISYLVTFLTCSVLLIFLTTSIQFKCQATTIGLKNLGKDGSSRLRSFHYFPFKRPF